MASHAQVQQNERDVSGAWGRFRDLVHQFLPGSAQDLTFVNQVVGIRRRYK